MSNRNEAAQKLAAHLRALGITPTIDACRAYRAGQISDAWNKAHPFQPDTPNQTTNQGETNQ